MVSRTEGDINLTPERSKWQEKFLSQDTINVLEEDSDVFIHQALSSPCLDCVTGVDGIYLYTKDGRKIMDFHGNSVHQLGYNHPYLISALEKQLRTLSFSPRRFTNEKAIALAQKLSALNGGGKKVLFIPAAHHQ